MGKECDRKSRVPVSPSLPPSSVLLSLLLSPFSSSPHQDPLVHAGWHPRTEGGGGLAEALRVRGVEDEEEAVGVLKVVRPDRRQSPRAVRCEHIHRVHREPSDCTTSPGQRRPRRRLSSSWSSSSSSSSCPQPDFLAPFTPAVGRMRSMGTRMSPVGKTRLQPSIIVCRGRGGRAAVVRRDLRPLRLRALAAPTSYRLPRLVEAHDGDRNLFSLAEPAHAAADQRVLRGRAGSGPRRRGEALAPPVGLSVGPSAPDEPQSSRIHGCDKDTHHGSGRR